MKGLMPFSSVSSLFLNVQYIKVTFAKQQILKVGTEGSLLKTAVFERRPYFLIE